MDPDMYVARELYDAMRAGFIEGIANIRTENAEARAVLWNVIYGLSGTIGLMGVGWWRYAVGQAKRQEAQIDDLLKRLKEVPNA